MVLVIVPLALLAAGCGGSSSSSAPPTTTTTARRVRRRRGRRAPRSRRSRAASSSTGSRPPASAGFGDGRAVRAGASVPREPPAARPRFGRFGPAGASGRRGGGFGRNLTAAQQKAFTACRSKLPAGTGRFRPGGGAAAAAPRIPRSRSTPSASRSTASSSARAARAVRRSRRRARPARSSARPSAAPRPRRRLLDEHLRPHNQAVSVTTGGGSLALRPGGRSSAGGGARGPAAGAESTPVSSRSATAWPSSAGRSRGRLGQLRAVSRRLV